MKIEIHECGIDYFFLVIPETRQEADQIHRFSRQDGTALATYKNHTRYLEGHLVITKEKTNETTHPNKP